MRSATTVSWDVLAPFIEEVLEICKRQGEDIANIALTVDGENIACRVIVAIGPPAASAMDHAVSMLDAFREREAKQ